MLSKDHFGCDAVIHLLLFSLLLLVESEGGLLALHVSLRLLHPGHTIHWVPKLASLPSRSF